MSKDYERLADLMTKNYDSVISNIREVKDSVNNIKEKMEADHDTLIVLKSDLGSFKKTFEENKSKEEKYGRSFSGDIKAVVCRVDELEDYVIADKTREEERSRRGKGGEDNAIVTIAKKYWPHLLALCGVGTGIGGNL